MNLRPLFVEGANTDTDAAVGAYLSPVLVAFLMVHRPLEVASIIAIVYWLEAALT